MNNTTYFLFDDNLRLVDNTALNEALNRYEEVIPVLVLNNKDPFYLKSALELRHELQNIGSDLYVFDSMNIFDKFYITSNIISSIEYSDDDQINDEETGLYSIQQPKIESLVVAAKYPILDRNNHPITLTDSKIKGGRKAGLNLFCNCNAMADVNDHNNLLLELKPHIHYGTLSTREIYNFILQLYGNDSDEMTGFKKLISHLD